MWFFFSFHLLLKYVLCLPIIRGTATSAWLITFHLSVNEFISLSYPTLWSGMHHLFLASLFCVSDQSFTHAFMQFYFAQLQLQKTQYLQLGQNRGQYYGGSLPNVNQIGNGNIDLPFQVSPWPLSAGKSMVCCRPVCPSQLLVILLDIQRLQVSVVLVKEPRKFL